jgi:hypothetical protein
MHIYWNMLLKVHYLWLKKALYLIGIFRYRQMELITKPIQSGVFEKLTVNYYSRNSSFMEHDSSLPYWEESISVSILNAVHTSYPITLRSVLILYLDPYLCLPSPVFPAGFLENCMYISSYSCILHSPPIWSSVVTWIRYEGYKFSIYSL